MQPTGHGVLQVEPTDHCNLACRMCAPHFEGWDTVHGVPKGHLDPELWSRILDGFVRDEVSFDHVIFQWLGDPSLHPQLGRLISEAAEKLAGRVGYLRVDTNALVLTPPRVDALLQGQLREEGPPLLVVVTIDAHTPETYTHVKGRDALERVRSHVRHLVRRRRQLGPGCRVNLQLQFVVQPGNGHETEAFLDYWADLLSCQGGPAWHDEVLFKRLSVGGGAVGQAEADALYETSVTRRGIVSGRRGGVEVQVWEQRPWQEDDGHSGGRTACPGLWLTPVIRHDGALLACCADLHSEMVLGDLGEQGFLELWEGPAATQHRLAHLAGRFEGVCAGCGGINWYETTPEMAAAARSRGQELGLESP